MTNKSITLELPEWANWIAQDEHGDVKTFSDEPHIHNDFIWFSTGLLRVQSKRFVMAQNWRDSKINLNTHGAFIDADGILRKVESK